MKEQKQKAIITATQFLNANGGDFQLASEKLQCLLDELELLHDKRAGFVAMVISCLPFVN